MIITAAQVLLIIVRWVFHLVPLTKGYIPEPGRFLRTLLTLTFHGDKLKKLEFLTEYYFYYGLFKFDAKIYIFNPKLAQHAIYKLEKGAEHYLENSPLKNTFLGSSQKSPETRRAIASLFRKTSIEERAAIMISDIQKMCTIFKKDPKGIVNVTQWTLRMALDIVGHVLLELDLNGLEKKQEKMISSMLTILHRCYAMGEISSDSKEFSDANEEFDAITQRVLEEALSIDNVTIKGKRLVNSLHDACGFSEAKDNMKLFLMAGTETTASTIPVVMYLLVKYPHIQEELRQEAEELLESLVADPTTPLPKTESVLTEVLRLYPIAPFISRQNYEPVTLGDVNLKQHADVIIFTWGIHRSPHYWDKAKEFVPFRFLNTSKTSGNMFIPFGAGSRVCIGQHLAWLELRLAVAMLLYQFKFEHAQETPELNFVVDWAHAVVHPDKDMIFKITPTQNDPITLS
ncbi:cytochrome P450 4Z1-like [Saccostrea echinata]|uniref:cytochrome P450 4Z1-like n=1 Tax=Saccostrea echinata TaxID=191078 RepID=UPI002A7FF5E2|nr:cytochrome P450 4Z1-like [Saccostrea echinata]